MLHLVRHADAGNKHAWTGPDARRPLTGTGWRQARALVTQLDGFPITAIVASPTQRCLQTVEPLALQRALEVQTDSRLHVDADAGEAVRLVLDAPDTHVVWCTHGELIGEVLTRLHERGAPIGNAPEWVKGSTWRLQVVAGEVISATYQPPASS